MKLNLQIFATPTVVFAPVDEATGVVTDNTTITLTFSEAVRHIDDSEILDADLVNMIDFKLTDENGDNVECSMSINAGKTVVTIVSAEDLLPNQVYYVGVLADSFENATDEAVVAANVTWTTSPAITLAGTLLGSNTIAYKALVAGDVDGNMYVSQASDEKTIIVAYNSSADTNYDVTVKKALLPNYAGKDIADIVVEVPFGNIAIINVESARYADITGKINIDVENAAVKLGVFYKK